MKTKYSCIILIVLIIGSCVYPFEPKGLGSDYIENVIVVEGTISPGEICPFRISKLEGLSNDLYSELVAVEELFVEDQSGNIYNSYKEDGIYMVDLTLCSTAEKYRLVIVEEGERFETPMMDVIHSVEIESLSWTAEEFDGLSLYVSSSGDDENRYYKWSYEENWELTPTLVSSNIYNPETNSYFAKPIDDPRDYCWLSNNSEDIIIQETVSLEENKVKDKLLRKIHYMDKRLSYLYHLEVSQISLSKEAYSFWDMMSKNSSDIGGLFSPLPTEVKGNISSPLGSDKVIIGYIEAATIEKKDLYIYRSEHKIYRSEVCDTTITQTWQTGRWPILWEQKNDILYVDDLQGEVVWTPKICVDCRELGGTKNKPPFWPNDHK